VLGERRKLIKLAGAKQRRLQQSKASVFKATFAKEGRTEVITYKSAMACTYEWVKESEKYGGAMSTTATLVARSVGIWSRAFGIQLQLVPNQDKLFTYSKGQLPNGNTGALISPSASTKYVNLKIGDSEWEFGHFLHICRGGGASGAAYVGYGPCSRMKAGGATCGGSSPVASALEVVFPHELAHSFGIHHTWSGSSGQCSAKQFSNSDAAVELGSGITLTSYSGSCGDDNIKGRSTGAYFHVYALSKFEGYKNKYPQCGVKKQTDNNRPTASAPPQCTVPKNTAFFLSGTARDVDTNDKLYYTWEQVDASPRRVAVSVENTAGPLINSPVPSLDGYQRFFPDTNTVFRAKNAGKPLSAFNQYARASSVKRTMHLAMTVRDKYIPTRAGNLTQNDRKNDYLDKIAGSWHTGVTTVPVSDVGPLVVTAPKKGDTVAAPGTVQVSFNLQNFRSTDAQGATLKTATYDVQVSECTETAVCTGIKNIWTNCGWTDSQKDVFCFEPKYAESMSIACPLTCCQYVQKKKPSSPNLSCSSKWTTVKERVKLNTKGAASVFVPLSSYSNSAKLTFRVKATADAQEGNLDCFYYAVSGIVSVKKGTPATVVSTSIRSGATDVSSSQALVYTMSQPVTRRSGGRVTATVTTAGARSTIVPRVSVVGKLVTVSGPWPKGSYIDVEEHGLLSLGRISSVEFTVEAPKTKKPKTKRPSRLVTVRPTGVPTPFPTSRPTKWPTTRKPTITRTAKPTKWPTTRKPTVQPTAKPTKTTKKPTKKAKPPTNPPVEKPTPVTLPPTDSTPPPTNKPTDAKSASPTTQKPTSKPTAQPGTDTYEYTYDDASGEGASWGVGADKNGFSPVSFNPKSGSTTLWAHNGTFSITFGEAILPGKMGISFTEKGQLWCYMDFQNDAASITIDNNTVTVDVAVCELWDAATYSITIDAGFVVDGKTAKKPNKEYTGYTLTTIADTVAPSIVYTVPENKQRPVSEQTNIALHYNEFVLEGSGSVVLTGSDGTTQTLSTMDATPGGDNWITVWPELLSPSTLYTVTVSAGFVKDEAGNPSQQHSFEFTTGDSVPPELESVRAMERTGYPGYYDILLGFSEPVTFNTSSGAIWLSVNGVPVVNFDDQKAYSVDGKELKLSPSQKLMGPATYTVFMNEQSVKDYASNSNSDLWESSFTFDITQDHLSKKLQDLTEFNWEAYSDYGWGSSEGDTPGGDTFEGDTPTVPTVPTVPTNTGGGDSYGGDSYGGDSYGGYDGPSGSMESISFDAGSSLNLVGSKSKEASGESGEAAAQAGSCGSDIDSYCDYWNTWYPCSDDWMKKQCTSTCCSAAVTGCVADTDSSCSYWLKNGYPCQDEWSKTNCATSCCGL